MEPVESSWTTEENPRRTPDTCVARLILPTREDMTLALW
jgi:hypothetical protein